VRRQFHQPDIRSGVLAVGKRGKKVALGEKNTSIRFPQPGERQGVSDGRASPYQEKMPCNPATNGKGSHPHHFTKGGKS